MSWAFKLEVARGLLQEPDLVPERLECCARTSLEPFHPRLDGCEFDPGLVDDLLDLGAVLVEVRTELGQQAGKLVLHDEQVVRVDRRPIFSRRDPLLAGGQVACEVSPILVKGPELGPVLLEQLGVAVEEFTQAQHLPPHVVEADEHLLDGPLHGDEAGARRGRG